LRGLNQLIDKLADVGGHQTLGRILQMHN
jgi:hypothetical protein